MIQQLIIGLVFLGAVVYLGRMVYRNFRSNATCASGCGKCGAVDFNKLEKQLKQKGF